MRFINRSLDAVRMLAPWALCLLLTTTVAFGEDAETTIIVPPGATEVDLTPILAAYKSVDTTYGPFHGAFVTDGVSERYEPASSFWQTRSDFMLVHVRNITAPLDVTLRIRFVAGDAGFESAQASLVAPPLLPVGWRPWTIDDPDGLLTTISPGLLSPEAHLFEIGLEGQEPSFSVPVDDVASGQGHTTSTTTVDVEVRDIPNRPAPGDEIPTALFYSIADGGVLVAEIKAEWIQNDWNVHVSSPTDFSTPVRMPLEFGPNRLLLRRWRDLEDGGGTELYVNDKFVANVASLQHSASEEVHTLIPTSIISADGLELIVENPKVRRSSILIDTETQVIEDRFTGGPSSDWQVVNPATQQFTPQDLPGPGQRFDIDLGLLSSVQSSYVSKSLSLPAGGVVDAQGYGLRFWIDPTSVTMPADGYLGVFAGCPQTGTCSALRVWLVRSTHGTGFWIHLTAQRSSGSFVGVATPVTTAPHQVEVRMRNSWLPTLSNGSIELWIDGTLINRVENVDNYDKQLDLIRFGAFSPPAVTTGILGLDEFAFWRFD